MVDACLQPVLDALLHAYPRGVPDADYDSLLAVLATDMSQRSLGAVVGELLGKHPVLVSNDWAVVAGRRMPASAEVERVRQHLVAHGWEPEDQPGGG